MKADPALGNQWHAGGRAETSAAPLRASGWGLSFVFHVCLLVFAASSLKSCGGSAPVDAGTDYRAVGLVERPASDSISTETTEPVEPAIDAAAEISNVPSATALDSAAPPIELDLPEADLIGSGIPKPSPLRPQFVPDSVPSNVGAASGSPMPAPAGLKAGAAEFLGVSDSGKRFVYVIDHSGSMQEHNKLAIAKAELISSLQALDAEQLFQIVFYNQDPHTLKLPVRKADGMFYSTDINRTLAGQLINSVRADGGTNHMPALELALSFKPDVIFLLTDADEPRLSAKELDVIRRWNKNGARIHCVEFGTGPEIGTDSYLVDLARRNGGTRRYHDTSRFARR
ncbi:hypothetical protein [Stratiformator vulcanicus]|uniref:VWFA domain-containing protein n=1 Tax=Stratiformator vulcanicus TaxID=2527980 RepID=A0A517QZE2_9PLAN|nr:hypothetical protein [Stratiformator vulcanicus]QDT37017.1 hypothetical protein Pan189_13830 [Stratiformator vulcanicus]